MEFEPTDSPTKVVTVFLGDDAVFEGVEYFTVSLFVASSALRDRVTLMRDTTTVRITDNDG